MQRRRFFPPVEKHLLASYARWVGGQAARAEASVSERQHALGYFLATSTLLSPFADDDRVIAFVRHHFEAGWRQALTGQVPGAPCGWPGGRE
jgi:hypothetical protein